jgi:DNA repair protein RecO (recombination protein O)
MIVRTDALVLRAFDYGETSQIVTLFTQRHGVLSVLAKGSRRPKSRFGSTLQPMAYVQAVYYFKPSRSLQTLRETAHVERFPHLAADLDRTTVGLRMVELTRALLHEGDPNPPIFSLLAGSLAALDLTARPANLLAWFQLRLAALLGFAPDVQRDDVDNLPDDGGLLLLDTGTIAGVGFAGRGGLRASRSALRAFAVLARTDLDVAMRLHLDTDLRADVETLVEAYLRYHVDDAYPGRVRRVTGQMTTSLSPST